MNKYVGYAIAGGLSITIVGLAIGGAIGFGEAIELVQCAWTEGCQVVLPAVTSQ